MVAGKRYTRRELFNYQVSNSELKGVYEELEQEVDGSKSSNFRFLSKVLFLVLCFTLLVGGLRGASFRSIRGGPASSKQTLTLLVQNNETATSTLTPEIDMNQISNATGTTVDILKPIVHGAKHFERGKRVLAMGGSTTWGSKLQDRTDAYPTVLSDMLGVHWQAVNIADQVTDASYASQCVESMIREAAASVEDMVKDFDVILLEYSLNGLDGVHLLVRRLRRRYPRAIIIYVHLWSLRATIENVETGARPRAILMEPGHTVEETEKLVGAMIQHPKILWKYSEETTADSKQRSKAGFDATQKVQGFLYELSVPADPQEAIRADWFASDYHHLSQNGHRFVAQELYNLLAQLEANNPASVDTAANDHSWGKGDQCYSWFGSGQSPFVRFEGGTMAMFATPGMWALQIGEGFGHPATIEFENTKDSQQPIKLEVMSYGPSTYPKVKVQLNLGNKKLDDSALVVDPLHPIQLRHAFHVPRHIHIGWVEPGMNSVTIDSMETKEHPLRVTGIVMCGACAAMDNGE
jgi:lysophospholipase L1-like esterase